MKKKNELLWEHYEKNFGKFVKRASRVLDDWHYGEDCVQEAYESGLRYLHTFSGDNFDGWFYVVYVNTLRKYLRFIKTQGMNQEIKMSDHPMFPSEMVDKYKGLIKKEIKE